MAISTASLCGRLTSVSVRHPVVTISAILLVVVALLTQAATISKEVGYASYFGPDDPKVLRLGDFLNEFQSGIHVLLVFSCRETSKCEAVNEPWALDYLGRLQSRIEGVAHVRQTWSILNTPIVEGPLSAETLALRGPGGDWELQDEWPQLFEQAREQAFVTGTVLSEDAVTAGVVVELQSIQSIPMSEAVHGIEALVPAFEEELGSRIYMAGDPVWTVYSADSLNSDSSLLTVVMFIVMLILLWFIFRDLSLTILPVATIGVLYGAVQGITAVIGLPLTSVLTALPPMIVVIGITVSIHYISAWVQIHEKGSTSPYIDAAESVGPGCFWSALTTTLGVGSFMLSDLATFQHFGLLASIGLCLSFVLTFTFLPSLLVLRSKFGGWAPPAERALVPSELLAATHTAVTQAPGLVLSLSLGVALLLGLGVGRLQYATDFGFGENSFVFRSLNFIDANFRRPMTTEVAVSIPEGITIFDEPTLRILQEVEDVFEAEPTTGAVWSFLDLLSEAHRVDYGSPPDTLDDLIASAPREAAIVTSLAQSPSYWSVTVPEGSSEELHRARVSIDRGWLDDDVQGPYVQRLHRKLGEVESRYADQGYRVDLEGGLILADLFVNELRDTQQRSFLAAFLIVSITLIILLRSDRKLLAWSILANVIPVVALLGLMGWAGIGIDPANTMVGAVLLVIAVDDTIHVALRYLSERHTGLSVSEALDRAYSSVGEAIVISTLCLAVGFSVLFVSEWAGLMWFGVLASLGVILALLSDLLLLPSGLLVTAARNPESVEEAADGAS